MIADAILTNAEQPTIADAIGRAVARLQRRCLGLVYEIGGNALQKLFRKR